MGKGNVTDYMKPVIFQCSGTWHYNQAGVGHA